MEKETLEMVLRFMEESNEIHRTYLDHMKTLENALRIAWIVSFAIGGLLVLQCLGLLKS